MDRHPSPRTYPQLNARGGTFSPKWETATWPIQCDRGRSRRMPHCTFGGSSPLTLPWSEHRPLVLVLTQPATGRHSKLVDTYAPEMGRLKDGTTVRDVTLRPWLVATIDVLALRSLTELITSSLNRHFHRTLHEPWPAGDATRIPPMHSAAVQHVLVYCNRHRY